MRADWHFLATPWKHGGSFGPFACSPGVLQEAPGQKAGAAHLLGLSGLQPLLQLGAGGGQIGAGVAVVRHQPEGLLEVGRGGLRDGTLCWGSVNATFGIHSCTPCTRQQSASLVDGG